MMLLALLAFVRGLRQGRGGYRFHGLAAGRVLEQLAGLTRNLRRGFLVVLGQINHPLSVNVILSHVWNERQLPKKGVTS